MAWLEITVNTASKDVEDVAARLTARGYADLVIEDQAEFESFLEENRAYWDYIDDEFQKKLEGLSRIKLYLEESDEAGLARLRDTVAELGLTMEAKPLPETDWEESWKDSYPPQEVGENLVVLPYWLAEEKTGRKKIILDPGLTFGTGAHPSTQMVMEAMEQRVQPGWHCLDLGSGSGMDIDPKAEDIARENAAYNGFGSPAFTALTGNVTEDKALMGRLSQERYDLLLVNIVADVIIGLSPILPDFMGEHTLLICSGILDSRLGDVTAALEKAGLTITEIRAKEEWRCVLAKREGGIS